MGGCCSKEEHDNALTPVRLGEVGSSANAPAVQPTSRPRPQSRRGRPASHAGITSQRPASSSARIGGKRPSTSSHRDSKRPSTSIPSHGRERTRPSSHHGGSYRPLTQNRQQRQSEFGPISEF